MLLVCQMEDEQKAKEEAAKPSTVSTFSRQWEMRVIDGRMSTIVLQTLDDINAANRERYQNPEVRRLRLAEHAWLQSSEMCVVLTCAFCLLVLFPGIEFDLLPPSTQPIRCATTRTPANVPRTSTEACSSAKACSITKWSTRAAAS
jgi:hypothetical protein